nr:thiol reductant ABC exporter subunit CydD [Paenibacillus bovis]
MSLKELAFGQRGKVILLIMMAVLSGAVIVAQGYLIVSIIDQVFLQEATFTDIAPFLYTLLAILFARAAFHFLSGRTGVKMAAKVKGDLRKSLLQRYSRNPLQASLRGQSGQKVSVLMDTVDEIDSYFSSYMPQLIQATIIPIILLIVISTQHIATAIIILITAPFIPIYMIVIGFKTKDKSEEQLDKMAAFSGKFLDTLQGITTLKLFGRARQQKEAIKKSSLDFREATMQVLKIAFNNSLALEFISMLSMGLIAMELAIRLIIYQNIDFFTAFFMLVLAPEFYTKLKDLGSAFHTGRGSMGAAKKLEKELLEEETKVDWGETNLEKNTPPSIELKAASFSYGSSEFTLKNININMQPYEQIAIVGKTGAGKSTLLLMLAGLVPLSEGQMLINGRERSTIREQDWFDQLSYISQHPYLFSGTMAENIAIGRTEKATRSEIEHAAKKAGLLPLIATLEHGLDTPIGEAGRGISGGEKQRIALARAFLKNPSVILFDEPTTGLDLETEQILQAAMMELSKTATVITVAHRLHTIKIADKILFLEHGELLATGTHDELIASVPAYREMVSIQQGRDE